MAGSLVFAHGGVAGAPGESVDLSDAVSAGAGADRALDAVEAATRVLEDHPALNAGSGAVLNRAGEVELDAGICDGRSGRAGGVASVRVRNPIALARRVMEQTPHVLMVGAGANELGNDMERVTAASDQVEKWRRAQALGQLTDEAFGAAASVDTVGAVAIDPAGNLAAASSTGGVFGKLPGRVGDAAILGAGMFASRSAAVVGTGVGELFMRWLASFRVAAFIEGGEAPQDACRRVIEAIAKIDPRPIGLLAVDPNGDVGAAYAGARWPLNGPDGPIEAERLGDQ
jgi:beta-aspartyl-peptidase (threonine type)